MMKNKLTQISKHPFAPFFLFGLFLTLIPILRPVLGVTFVDAFAKVLIFYIVALGFSFLIGYGGLASLGTSSFIAVGTFVLYIITEAMGLPFFVSILVAIAAAVVIGLFFGFVSLRIEGMYLAIVTLGISEIAVEVFKNLGQYTGGVSGRTYKGINIFGNTLSPNAVFIIIIAFVVLAMILTYNLFNSPTGRALLSVKNSDSAARAMGISVLRVRLTAFIVSAVYAVLGGLLYMGYVRFSMAQYWSLSISLNILAAVVVGGSKSIWGVFIGTFVIFGLDLVVFKQIFDGTNLGDLSYIISGILIILVMMYFPGGIIGLINDIRAKRSKKKLEKLQQEETKAGDVA